jgi:MFS family permease
MAHKSDIEEIEVAREQEDQRDGLDLYDKDKAIEFLKASGGPILVTAEESKRILRKIDLTILPIILGIYFLQSLDKTSLAYASVFGLIHDARLVGDQYSWLGAIVYIAQLVLQPPVAYVLVKLPIGKVTAIMVLCWGAILCIMAATTNFTGLMITRFLLGAFEASVGMY